ncbi:MAG: TfoX/Sxy family protein [Bdellovibrionia bacterium]
MAFDEALAERIRKLLKSDEDVLEKRMFGGLCFMHRGNMMCGIEKSRLMLRVGPEQYQKALSLKHASPMDFTGVPLKGFVFVAPLGYRNDKALKGWLRLGLKFTNTLPAKPKKVGKAALMRGNRKQQKGGPTLLSSIKNFGPVTLAEFHSMNITTLEQLKKTGFEDMCRKYVMYYPNRLNANAFLGVICSIENTVWTQATARQRSEARNMVRLLKTEFGISNTRTRLR